MTWPKGGKGRYGLAYTGRRVSSLVPWGGPEEPETVKVSQDVVNRRGERDWEGEGVGEGAGWEGGGGEGGGEGEGEGEGEKEEEEKEMEKAREKRGRRGWRGKKVKMKSERRGKEDEPVAEG
jgi:hypothetical protein